MSYATKVLILLCTILLPVLSLAQNCSANIFNTTPTPTPSLISSRFKNEGEPTATTALDLLRNPNVKVPDGTLLDTKTGRLWKKCSEGQMASGCSGSPVKYTREQALEQAQKANNTKFAGYRDWRVPTIKEFTGITERKCIQPAINLSLFANTPSDLYWTSEPYSYYANHAWYYNFVYGYADYSLSQDNLYNVRLVRGP